MSNIVENNVITVVWSHDWFYNECLLPVKMPDISKTFNQ